MAEPTIVHRCPDCKYCFLRFRGVPSYSFSNERYVCNEPGFCEADLVTGQPIPVKCNTLRTEPTCPGFSPIPIEPKKLSLWARFVGAVTGGSK